MITKSDADKLYYEVVETILNGPSIFSSVCTDIREHIEVCRKALQEVLDIGLSLDYVPYAWEKTFAETAIQYRPKIIGMLIDAGANINKKDSDGRNLLLQAVCSRKQCDMETFSKIVSHTQNINAEDKKGGTALLYLCKKYMETEKANILLRIGILLDRGADFKDWRLNLIVAPASKLEKTRKAKLADYFNKYVNVQGFGNTVSADYEYEI